LTCREGSDPLTIAPAEVADAGHDVVHVTSMGLAGHPDDEIRAAAEQQRTVILRRHQLRRVLAQSGAALPRIVLLRRGSHRPDDRAALLMANLPALEPEPAGGAIAVITDDRVRVRPLPLI
jgi:predicted nuclease of predicted toxin-antitoxin system